MEKGSSSQRVEGSRATLNKPMFILRAGIVVVIAMMLILLAGASFTSVLSAHAAPAAQDGTDYPVETVIFDDPDDDYPVETEIPFEEETPFFEDETPFDFETDVVSDFTETPTSTIPPNSFLTESAEMGNSGLATPLVSETPAPTITLYITPTAATPTPRPTRSLAASKSDSRVDWGYFSLGFAVPVLAACGLVLYLLDRRPEFFRRRK